MEQIILQKEKQIAAMAEVDPVNSDVGALQLGARAISMYTEALQLRQQNKEKEDRISHLNAEVSELTEKCQVFQQELDFKRKELNDATQMNSEKTSKIQDLESELQLCKQNISDKSREIDSLIDAMESARKANTQELGARSRVIEELREELGKRDHIILEEKAARVRIETLNADLERKNDAKVADLKEGQEAMDAMMAHNQYYFHRIIQHVKNSIIKYEIAIFVNFDSFEVNSG